MGRGLLMTKVKTKKYFYFLQVRRNIIVWKEVTEMSKKLFHRRTYTKKTLVMAMKSLVK
jgi:hypothetical protein